VGFYKVVVLRAEKYGALLAPFFYAEKRGVAKTYRTAFSILIKPEEPVKIESVLGVCR
jgi:hypothetical protein